MGFFSNLLQGKPIYDDSAPKKPGSIEQSTDDGGFRNARGEKIYPALVVERSDCRLQGDRMTVYAYIKNDSEFPLTLDRVRFLGSDKQMPSDLSVGESMQFMVFDGPRPHETREANLELTYCNQARDYFSALYYAEFKQEADHTYSVKQFKRQREVKDI